MSRQRGAFTWIRPDAGAICYARYHYDINSLELANRLRVEKSVLIVPGDHFGMDRYIRFGYGERTNYLQAGLARISELLADVPLAARV